MGRRIVGFAIAVGLLAASCGSDPTVAVPTDEGASVAALDAIPSAALPGRPATPVALDAGALGIDAVDVSGLEDLLHDAGFVAGTERRFSLTRGGRRLMVARVLSFETPKGAERYLGWLRSHVDEVIGDAAPSRRLSAPNDGAVFVHQPSPCCHNETRIFLAMWHEGRRVVTLKFEGQAAQASAVPELVSRLDAAV